MTCESCTPEVCRRRMADMTQRQKELCATKIKYAELWDKNYGVTDPSVIPDCYSSSDETQHPKTQVRAKAKKPRTSRNRKKRRFRLGDQIESALNLVGVTQERVEKWIGGPCNCPERKKNYNALSDWAQDVLFGKLDDTDKEDALEQLISGESK